MFEEIQHAMGMVASGKTERKDMRSDLSTAAANIVLARSVTKADKNASHMAHALVSMGFPTSNQPLPRAISKVVSKMPNGKKVAEEVTVRGVFDNLGSGLREWSDAKLAKQARIDQVNKDYSEGKFEKSDSLVGQANSDKGMWEGVPKPQQGTFGLFPKGSGMDHLLSFTAKAALITGTVAVGAVLAAPVIGLSSAAALIVGSKFIGFAGAVTYTAGSMLVEAAADVAVKTAKAIYEELKPVRDDIMKKAGSVADMAADAKGAISSAAKDADKAFNDAKNRMGQVARDTEATLEDMGKAFDDTKASAEKFIDALPDTARKELDSAWKEAAVIGAKVEKEMAGLSSKMSDLASGVSSFFSKEKKVERKKTETPMSMLKKGLSEQDAKPSYTDSALKDMGFPELKKEKPALAAAVKDTLSKVDKVEAEAMKAAKPLIDRASKAVGEATKEAKEMYKDSVKSLEAATKSSLDNFKTATDSVSSLFDIASKKMKGLSDLVDKEAAKSGKIWVEGYVKDNASIVEGFWRKAASKVFGKEVKK
jgi:vacuolar-type H+-ATPase subunit H